MNIDIDDDLMDGLVLAALKRDYAINLEEPYFEQPVEQTPGWVIDDRIALIEALYLLLRYRMSLRDFTDFMTETRIAYYRWTDTVKTPRQKSLNTLDEPDRQAQESGDENPK
ncbi:hypothetical protein [Marinobacterium sp. xm-a-152]|uniref:hypothetical protein n=1 Tax=Marinobacterium sp. xm-a-152 TaxID=2497733 RepID=UPI00156A0D3A|nr:hypothetical protein [Marinobacterium sp. xm-a-152]NRP15044.1 hypothetical protein [Marinobacterium sp. xm-a-152]